jgi:AbrB family looped-hinge helix DNA binding protein
MLDATSRNDYHHGMNSTVSEKGQVTIPKKLRERLGIRAGDELDFETEGGRLVATKVSHQHPVDRVFGILRGQGSTDEAIRALRGEPDAV